MNESFNDERNDFWDEVCGTIAFRNLGLKEITPSSLKIFDAWYMNAMYPYLYNYLPFAELADNDVLEIGLGFGTVGEKLFLSARSYIGVDFAQNPVDLMNYRIKLLGKENTAKALRGDVRSLSFGNDTFDLVVSIGCLHHTGDVSKSVQEIYRVLKKGTKAVIMLYNKNSFRRRVTTPLRYIMLKSLGRFKFKTYAEYDRAIHDTDAESNVAPITDFLSRVDVKKVFSDFRKISIEVENFDDLYIPKTRIGIPRKYLLNNIAKIWGADFYITAIK